jgi:transaldolase
VTAELGVKIFADGADLRDLRSLVDDPLIKGFTTNPTLMRQAGVDDYTSFAKELVAIVTDRPVSFEVTTDDFAEMERQALRLHELGDNVRVKIPITDTSGASATPLMARLAIEGVSVNATAILTADQVRAAADALAAGPPAIVSVFAGRIADAGVDPVPAMAEAVELLRPYPNLELLWASPREVLNVVQADQIGCHIITLTPDLLHKLHLLGRDLADFSLATVKMFHDDAAASGYDF